MLCTCVPNEKRTSGSRRRRVELKRVLRYLAYLMVFFKRQAYKLMKAVGAPRGEQGSFSMKRCNIVKREIQISDHRKGPKQESVSNRIFRPLKSRSQLACVRMHWSSCTKVILASLGQQRGPLGCGGCHAMSSGPHSAELVDHDVVSTTGNE